MNDEQQAASSLTAAGLGAMRAASGALRAADAALATRPTHASNTRWFVKMFVLPRRVTAVRADELFWTNLDIARDQHIVCDQALSTLFREHNGIDAVMRLQVDLSTAGYDGIHGSLHENVLAGDEAEASQQLRPVVARMRSCETRMLAAIQALAAAD